MVWDIGFSAIPWYVMGYVSIFGVRIVDSIAKRGRLLGKELNFGSNSQE